MQRLKYKPSAWLITMKWRAITADQSGEVSMNLGKSVPPVNNKDCWHNPHPYSAIPQSNLAAFWLCYLTRDWSRL